MKSFYKGESSGDAFHIPINKTRIITNDRRKVEPPNPLIDKSLLYSHILSQHSSKNNAKKNQIAPIEMNDGGREPKGSKALKGDEPDRKNEQVLTQDNTVGYYLWQISQQGNAQPAHYYYPNNQYVSNPQFISNQYVGNHLNYNGGYQQPVNGNIYPNNPGPVGFQVMFPFMNGNNQPVNSPGFFPQGMGNNTQANIYNYHTNYNI